MTIRIVYKSRWRDATIQAQSSEHPQYPAEDSQLDILTQPFRTRHGADSGNGLFVIDANNKYIDFDEGGGELNATLTEGNYNGNSLATEIKTQLDAVGAITYTVTYSESTGKFTIAGDANFKLMWKTGTKGSDNTDTHVGTTLGFDDSADDDGAAATFTSDYVRIHWPNAYIDVDCGSALAYDFVALLAHNISASATAITIYGADDAAFTTNLVTDTITHNATNIFKFLTAARTKRYIRIYVEDPTNTAGYISLGVIFVGSYWEPNRHFLVPYSRGRRDPSSVDRTDAQAVYSSEKEILDRLALPFKGITDTHKDNILAFLDEVGLTKAFCVVIDPTSPNNDSHWMINRALSPPENQHDDYWNWSLDIEEAK
ncbi:MAG: hypothetical protein KAR42_16705 [candidate division Zixibacteria bacterium]|nr:hypothetical protein [candidate division Zixibacteria bacterium]